MRISLSLFHKSASSKVWLSRQQADFYVAEAHRLGLRSRSYFKLQQLDEKFKLLRAGSVAVDLGCAPGGWLEYTTKKVGAKGHVFGVDLLRVEPLANVSNVTILDKQDFTHGTTIQHLTSALGGRQVGMVMSDMAPNASGMPASDKARIFHLADLVTDFAINPTSGVLGKRGHLVIKLWQAGADGLALRKRLQPLFETVREWRPPATRKNSAEYYLIATQFKKN